MAGRLAAPERLAAWGCGSSAFGDTRCSRLGRDVAGVERVIAFFHERKQVLGPVCGSGRGSHEESFLLLLAGGALVTRELLAAENAVAWSAANRSNMTQDLARQGELASPTLCD